MTATLPVVYSPAGAGIVDAETGEVVHVRDASDALLASTVDAIKQMQGDARDTRSLLEAELIGRLTEAGERSMIAGAHGVETGERREWDPDATWRALGELVDAGAISARMADELMPEKTERRPDGRGLNALLVRLAGVDPEAAGPLARARHARAWVTVKRVAVNSTATEAS